VRLGVVGVLADDFRSYTPEQLEAVAAMGFSGFGCHFDSAAAFDVSAADCKRFKRLCVAANLDLAQFSLSYNECLFAPHQAGPAAAKIARGIALARQLAAQTLLIRPGSLNPAGPWTPHRDNRRPENLERLIATLRPLARQAEAADVLIVLETHAISIVDSPETCPDLVAAVGSAHLRVVMDAVNHFESLRQVYDSGARIDHIFDVIGPIAPVMHIKDIAVAPRLTLHLDEAAPGEGELDIGRMLRRFDALHPAGYGLIEHLPAAKVPAAAAHVRRVADEQGVRIY
jgi:sugar phosphate isomerase/epimerase